jgi:hypothetical protein
MNANATGLILGLRVKMAAMSAYGPMRRPAPAYLQPSHPARSQTKSPIAAGVSGFAEGAGGAVRKGLSSAAKAVRPVMAAAANPVAAGARAMSKGKKLVVPGASASGVPGGTK